MLKLIERRKKKVKKQLRAAICRTKFGGKEYNISNILFENEEQAKLYFDVDFFICMDSIVHEIEVDE